MDRSGGFKQQWTHPPVLRSACGYDLQHWKSEIKGCQLLGYRSIVAEGSFLLQYNAASIVNRIPTFRRNVIATFPRNVGIPLTLRYIRTLELRITHLIKIQADNLNVQHTLYRHTNSHGYPYILAQVRSKFRNINLSLKERISWHKAGKETICKNYIQEEINP